MLEQATSTEMVTTNSDRRKLARVPLYISFNKFLHLRVKITLNGYSSSLSPQNKFGVKMSIQNNIIIN